MIRTRLLSALFMRCLVLSLWHVAMYITSGNILLELIHSTVCDYLLKCLVLSLWHVAMYITWGHMYVTCICYIHNMLSVAACCSMFHVYVTHVWYIHIASLKILQHAATLKAICMLYTYEWQHVCFIHISVAVCCSRFKEAMCI